MSFLDYHLGKFMWRFRLWGTIQMMTDEQLIESSKSLGLWVPERFQ